MHDQCALCQPSQDLCTHGQPRRPLSAVPAGQQWASTTSSRRAADSYSWMQAVHHGHDTGRHKRMSDSVLRTAALLAQLNPCRPGIRYLMRRLGLAERTVQYHLAALRESGLLAYLVKGTRRSNQPPLASEFALVIPPWFDQDLGIKTFGNGFHRRMVGIAAHGRTKIADLATKAARSMRPRRRGKSPRPPRCTPMEAVTTHVRTASVERDLTTTAKPKAKKRTARRSILGRTVTAAMMAAGNQLARAARRKVPWVRSSTHDQLRWVANDAAAQGWTEQQWVTYLHEVGAAHPSMGALWQPNQPHALIARAILVDAAESAAQQSEQADRAAAVRPETNAAWREACANLRKSRQGHDQERHDHELTDSWSRELARLEGAYRPEIVVQHLSDHGLTSAENRFGARLVRQATSLWARGDIALHNHDGVMFSTW